MFDRVSEEDFRVCNSYYPEINAIIYHADSPTVPACQRLS